MAELEGFKWLCAASDIAEKSKGFRFKIHFGDEYAPAFAIRYDGKVNAFLNRCAHQAIELDWNEGEFFDVEYGLLLCATHGAQYHPADGHCVGGRCQGRGLTQLNVIESAGDVYIQSDQPLIKQTND